MENDKKKITLLEYEYDLYEERAAILEYEENLPRNVAEIYAKTEYLVK